MLDQFEIIWNRFGDGIRKIDESYLEAATLFVAVETESLAFDFEIPRPMIATAAFGRMSIQVAVVNVQDSPHDSLPAIAAECDSPVEKLTYELFVKMLPLEGN